MADDSQSRAPQGQAVVVLWLLADWPIKRLLLLLPRGVNNEEKHSPIECSCEMSVTFYFKVTKDWIPEHLHSPEHISTSSFRAGT